MVAILAAAVVTAAAVATTVEVEGAHPEVAAVAAPLPAVDDVLVALAVMVSAPAAVVVITPPAALVDSERI